jgi:hypothetical protein
MVWRITTEEILQGTQQVHAEEMAFPVLVLSEQVSSEQGIQSVSINTVKTGGKNRKIPTC